MLLLAVVLACLAPARAGAQLVRNGGFIEAEGDKPAGWTTDQWSPTLGTTFEWQAPTSGLGVVIVRNPVGNDARWTQVVRVQPETWYRLSGSVRAIGVTGAGFGASLGVMGAFENTRELKGEDSGWQQVAMWFKTKPGQNQTTIACRLGNYGQIAAGEVRCTGIEVTAVAAPPLNADFVYGPIDEATTPGRPARGGRDHRAAGDRALSVRAPAGRGRARRASHAARGPARAAGRKAARRAALPVPRRRRLLLRLVAEARRRGPRALLRARLLRRLSARLHVRAVGGRPAEPSAARRRWQSPTFLALLKLPALLADLAVARLIFARLRPGRKRFAWMAALAFALNPALLLNSTIWGQTDSVLALLALLSFLALGDRRFELAWSLAALAILTKPQALLVVPLFVLWPWGWWKSGRPLSALLAIVATVWVVADPFRGERPVDLAGRALHRHDRLLRRDLGQRDEPAGAAVRHAPQRRRRGVGSQHPDLGLRDRARDRPRLPVCRT